MALDAARRFWQTDRVMERRTSFAGMNGVSEGMLSK